MRLAHKLAIESDNVRADAVEAMEFPHLSMKYNVRGVPRIVINETIQIEGAMPEPMRWHSCRRRSNLLRRNPEPSARH